MPLPKNDATPEKTPLESIADYTDTEADRLLQLLEADAATQSATTKDRERNKLLADRTRKFRIHANGIGSIAGLGAILATLADSADPNLLVVKAILTAISFAGKGLTCLRSQDLAQIPGGYFSDEATKTHLEQCRNLEEIVLGALLKQGDQGGVSLALINATVKQYMAANPDLTPQQKRSAGFLLIRGIAQACQKRGIPLDTIQSQLAAAANYVSTRIKLKGGNAAEAAEALKLAKKLDKETTTELDSCVDMLMSREKNAYSAAQRKAVGEAGNTLLLLGALTRNDTLTTFAIVCTHTNEIGYHLQELSANGAEMLTPEKWLAGLNLTNGLLKFVLQLISPQPSLKEVMIQEFRVLEQMIVQSNQQILGAIAISKSELKQQIKEASSGLTKKIEEVAQRTEIVRDRQYRQITVKNDRIQRLLEEIRTLVAETQSPRLGENLADLIAHIELQTKEGRTDFLSSIKLDTARREYDILVAGIGRCASDSEQIPTEPETQLSALKDTEEDPKAWAKRLLRFFIHENSRYTAELEESLVSKSANFEARGENNPNVAAALQQLKKGVPPKDNCALTTNTAQPQTWLVLATHLQIYLELLPQDIRQQLALHEGSILNPAKNYLETIKYAQENSVAAHSSNTKTYQTHTGTLSTMLVERVKCLVSETIATQIRTCHTNLRTVHDRFSGEVHLDSVRRAIPTVTVSTIPENENVPLAILGGGAAGAAVGALIGGPVGFLIGWGVGIAGGTNSVESNRKRTPPKTAKQYTNLLKEGGANSSPLYRHHQSRLGTLLGSNVQQQEEKVQTCAAGIDFKELLKMAVKQQNFDAKPLGANFHNNFLPLRVMHLAVGNETQQLVELPESISEKIWHLVSHSADCLQLVTMTLLGLSSMKITATYSNEHEFTLTLCFTESTAEQTQRIPLGHFLSNPFPTGPSAARPKATQTWTTAFNALRQPTRQSKAAVNMTAALLCLYGSLEPDAARAAQASNTHQISLNFSPPQATPENWTQQIQEKVIRLQAIAIGYIQNDSEAPTDGLRLDKTDNPHLRYTQLITWFETLRLKTSGISTLIGRRAHQWQAKNTIEVLFERYKTELVPYNKVDLGFPTTPCQFQKAREAPLTVEIKARIKALESLFTDIKKEASVPQAEEDQATGGNDESSVLSRIYRGEPINAEEVAQEMTAEDQEQLARKLEEGMRLESERRNRMDQQVRALQRALENKQRNEGRQIASPRLFLVSSEEQTKQDNPSQRASCGPNLFSPPAIAQEEGLVNSPRVQEHDAAASATL